MFHVATEWNPKQQMLREALSKECNFKEAIWLCLELHGIVHNSLVSGDMLYSFYNEIWEGLSRDIFCSTLPQKNGFGRKATIAWNIWHITRIEDITANILIADESQVLNEDWLNRLSVEVKDTGNAMNDNDIINFSQSLDMEALWGYRNAVGLRTREILVGLMPLDLKRKFKKDSLTRILNEGGVVNDEKSIWLLDFWGRKNVAGILLMPITRHQIVHLNECMRIKNKLSHKPARRNEE